MTDQHEENGGGVGDHVPDVLPILPLRGCVAYPGLVLPLVVSRPASIAMMEQIAAGDGWLGMAALLDPETPEPKLADMYLVGAVGRIHRLWRTEEGTVQALVRVSNRIRLEAAEQETPHVATRWTAIPDQPTDTMAERALIRQLMKHFQELAELNPQVSGNLVVNLMASEESPELMYLISSTLAATLEWRQALLEADPFQSKLELVLEQVHNELEAARIGQSIQERVAERVGKQNREFFLREQLKQIQDELEDNDEDGGAIKTLKEKLEAGLLPREAEAEARRELKRLKQTPPASPEYGMLQSYLEWMGRVPWGITTGHTPDLDEARAVLDADHAGLDKVKERLLEYLAVRRLKAQRGMPHDDARSREPILCLVGPPGVGKTSLGRSIARALGRHFVRVSLGGVHDEAAIRGHRRTYLGAFPGRIIQALARAGSADPVIMLDEIDKMGADYRGDPSSALLELLDPEQNQTFRDHYLDVPCDLSRAIFIVTANTLETVSPPLRDRLEILSLAGYTEDEKVGIAQRFLTPRQLTSHGLSANDLKLEEGAIRYLIENYTREAGVRELERHIGTLCRKAALELAGRPGPIIWTPEDVRRLLGLPKFANELAERIDRPGIATGLVWTPVGGDILFIEATAVPGKKVLKLTGQLGDVMRESAEAALSYIRSKADLLGLDPRFFENTDLHVHVPGGAIPKDGPSAGITLSVALASALTGQPVRDDIAMTGEITLRGRVLPVGGIKEKVLGAKRAGLKTVLLPKKNQPDLEDIPLALRESMEFIFVDNVDEVWSAAFETMPGKQARSGTEPKMRLTPPIWYSDVSPQPQQGGTD